MSRSDPDPSRFASAIRVVGAPALAAEPSYAEPMSLTLLPLAEHVPVAIGSGKNYLFGGFGLPVALPRRTNVLLELLISRSDALCVPSAVEARQRIAAKARGERCPDRAARAAALFALLVTVEQSNDRISWSPLHRFAPKRLPGSQRLVLRGLDSCYLRGRYEYAFGAEKPSVYARVVHFTFSLDGSAFS